MMQMLKPLFGDKAPVKDVRMTMELPPGGGMPPGKQEQLKEVDYFSTGLKSLPRSEEGSPSQRYIGDDTNLPAVAYWGSTLDDRLLAMSTARYENAGHQVATLPSYRSQISYRGSEASARGFPTHQKDWRVDINRNKTLWDDPLARREPMPMQARRSRRAERERVRTPYHEPPQAPRTRTSAHGCAVCRHVQP